MTALAPALRICCVKLAPPPGKPGGFAPHAVFAPADQPADRAAAGVCTVALTRADTESYRYREDAGVPFPGRGFALRRLDASGEPAADEPYRPARVSLLLAGTGDPADDRCDCTGFLKTGLCKHVRSFRSAAALGLSGPL